MGKSKGKKPIESIYIRHASKAEVTTYENTKITSPYTVGRPADLVVIKRTVFKDRRYTPGYKSKIRVLRLILHADPDQFSTLVVNEPVGSILTLVRKGQ